MGNPLHRHAAQRLDIDADLITKVVKTRDGAHPDTDHKVTLVTGTEVFISLGDAPAGDDTGGEVTAETTGKLEEVSKLNLKADIEAYAAEHGIDISAARNNPERKAIIESAIADEKGNG